MNRAREYVRFFLPSSNLRFAWLIVVVGAIATTTVNALSFISDAARNNREIDIYLPWLYEYTSVVVTILLFPVVAWIVRLHPIRKTTWKKAIPLHFGFSIIFSAVHVAGMVALRKLLIGVFFGNSYSFFGDVISESLFEYRKDALTYALFILLLHVVCELSKRDEALEAVRLSRRQERLPLKSGKQTVWIEIEAFEFAKAAGNYVEVHGGGSMHLIRSGLARLGRKLRTAGVRTAHIHRSFIVNADKVIAIIPKGDGDAEITLSSGIKLPASRRYRNNFPT